LYLRDPEDSAFPVLLGSLAARLGRFLRVPPPNRWKSRHAVFRQGITTAEPVPACGPQLSVAPLRYDVLVPKQYTVKRSGGGDEVLMSLGQNDLRDHLVNCWVLDAKYVVRS